MITLVDESGTKYNLQTIVGALGFGIHWNHSDSSMSEMGTSLAKTNDMDDYYYFGTTFGSETFNVTLFSGEINREKTDILLSTLKGIFFNTDKTPKRLRVSRMYNVNPEPKFKYGLLQGKMDTTYSTDRTEIKFDIMLTSAYYLSEELYTSGEIPVTGTGYTNKYISIPQVGYEAKPVVTLKGTGEDVEVWLNDEYVKVGDMDGEEDETANNLLLGTATFTPLVTLYESGWGDYTFALSGPNLKVTNTKGFYGDESRFAWPLSEFLYLDGSFVTISMDIESGYDPPVVNGYVRVRLPYGEWVTMNPNGLDASGYFQHFEVSIKLPNNKLRVDEIYFQVANIKHNSGVYPSAIVFAANSMKMSRGSVGKEWTPARAEVPSTKNYLLGTGDFKVVLDQLWDAGYSDYIFSMDGVNLKVWNKGGYYGDETRFRWPLASSIKCIGQKMTLTANIKSGYEPPVENGFVRFRVPFTSQWLRLNQNGLNSLSTFQRYSVTFTLPNTGQVINELYFQVANLQHASGTYDSIIVFQNSSMKLEDGTVSNPWSSTPYSIVSIETDRFIVRKNLKETMIKVPRKFLLVPGEQMRVRGKDMDLTVEVEHRNTYI